MIGYRIASAAQATCYMSVAFSIMVNPPAAKHGQTTVFDVLNGGGIIVGSFIGTSLLMLYLTVFFPRLVYLSHHALFILIMAFGVANVGTSVINGGGWITASLCFSLAAGHSISIRRRPPTVKELM